MAFLLLTVVMVATIIGFGELLQVSGDSPFQWLIPVLYLAVAGIGFVWALIMRAARPEVYAAIGRGADNRVSILADSNQITKSLHADPVGARGYPY
jgi:hypothetical protein